MRLGPIGLVLMMLATLIRSAPAQSPAPKTLERILEDLVSANVEVRNKAREAGHAYLDEWRRRDVDGMREDLPVLMAAINRPDPGVRLSASAFLATVALLRPGDVMAFLAGYEREVLGGFHDPHSVVRANLVRCFALAEPAPPRLAVEPFMNALEGPPSESRKLAVLGLARAAPESLAAADAIVTLLDRIEDPEERRESIQVLAFAKPAHPVIIAKLVEQLEMDHALLLEDTIRTLGEIGTPAAAQAGAKLRALADDVNADPEMRSNAAAALRAVEGRPSPRP